MSTRIIPSAPGFYIVWAYDDGSGLAYKSPVIAWAFDDEEQWAITPDDGYVKLGDPCVGVLSPDGSVNDCGYHETLDKYLQQIERSFLAKGKDE